MWAGSWQVKPTDRILKTFLISVSSLRNPIEQRPRLLTPPKQSHTTNVFFLWKQKRVSREAFRFSNPLTNQYPQTKWQQIQKKQRNPKNGWIGEIRSVYAFTPMKGWRKIVPYSVRRGCKRHQKPKTTLLTRTGVAQLMRDCNYHSCRTFWFLLLNCKPTTQKNLLCSVFLTGLGRCVSPL